MREDPARGFYAEGLSSVTLVSAEHALGCIAAGDTQRKACSHLWRLLRATSPPASALPFSDLF